MYREKGLTHISEKGKKIAYDVTTGVTRGGGKLSNLSSSEKRIEKREAL